MRITRIDVEGEAGNHATLRRRPSGQITIDVRTSADSDRLVVATSDGARQDRWAAALKVQATLEGVAGTNSMVHDYFDLINRLAD